MVFKIIKNTTHLYLYYYFYNVLFPFSLKKKCAWEGNGDSVLQDYIMYLFFKENVLGNSMF